MHKSRNNTSIQTSFFLDFQKVGLLCRVYENPLQKEVKANSESTLKCSERVNCPYCPSFDLATVLFNVVNVPFMLPCFITEPKTGSIAPSTVGFLK